MIKSKICDLVGIKYPIFQGGMAWISDANLAAAVSEAGGLGIISAMNANAEYVREEIRKCKELTKKPINYIMVSDGLSQMKDISIILDEIFDKKVYVSDIKDIGVRNNEFSSAVGLIKWYNYMQGLKDKDYSIFTLKEQEELSKFHEEDEDNNNSVIGKFFSYFLDD